MLERLTLVCAVDGSPRARLVADAARWLAQALDASVVLAHVFDPMMIPMPPTRELHLTMSTEEVEEQERRLARHAFADAADALGDVEHASLFLEGGVSAEILRLIGEHDPYLLVMGATGRRPLERVLQGSLPADLLVRARCPVVVVPDDAVLTADGPVLAAYDGSEHSLHASRHGAALAARLGRDLVLVHVAEPGEPTVEVDAALARDLHAAAGAVVTKRLDVAVATERGDPVEKLAQVARERDASLVVVGSRGRNAVSAAIFGSVSAGVVRTAGRPVVVAGPQAT